MHKSSFQNVFIYISRSFISYRSIVEERTNRIISKEDENPSKICLPFALSLRASFRRARTCSRLRAGRETEATHAPSSLSPIRGMRNCSRSRRGSPDVCAMTHCWRANRETGSPRDSPLLRPRSEMWNIFQGVDGQRGDRILLRRREISLRCIPI